jgi:hypothetical protein
MVSRVAGQTGVLVLVCLKPAAASEVMQNVRGSCFDWKIAGPGLATEKSWTPLLRIGDANSNAA